MIPGKLRGLSCPSFDVDKIHSILGQFIWISLWTQSCFVSGLFSLVLLCLRDILSTVNPLIIYTAALLKTMFDLIGRQRLSQNLMKRTNLKQNTFYTQLTCTITALYRT